MSSSNCHVNLETLFSDSQKTAEQEDDMKVLLLASQSKKFTTKLLNPLLRKMGLFVLHNCRAIRLFDYLN